MFLCALYGRQNTLIIVASNMGNSYIWGMRDVLSCTCAGNIWALPVHRSKQQHHSFLEDHIILELTIRSRKKGLIAPLNNVMQLLVLIQHSYRSCYLMTLT